MSTYYPPVLIATTYVTLISQVFYSPIDIATAYVSIFTHLLLRIILSIFLSIYPL